jgi:hypothetical protein
MKTLTCAIAFLLLLITCGGGDQRPAAAPPARADAMPEAGPEESGLRLRLLVAPPADGRAAAAQKDGYDVRLDLLNTSQQPITLLGKWRNEDQGDIAAYLEAATSIECVPQIAPWVGGVQESPRKLPQPRQVLAAGETLSMHWQTDGRHLKNRVTDPNEVQNPTFPFPGLYAVHATLDVITADGGTMRLRSNEQLVCVGGSRAMPKYTRGPLLSVDAEKKTARLGLGTLQKAKVGDTFEIGHPKGKFWKLTLTSVSPQISQGTLELLTHSTYAPFRELPTAYEPATLVVRE